MIWAAAGGMRGFTPEGMIARIRRNVVRPREDWEHCGVRLVDVAIVYSRLRSALDIAEAFVNKMPTDLVGMIFLLDGKVVQPDPERLDHYQARGHWPSNSEIETAMLEQYNLKPLDP